MDENTRRLVEAWTNPGTHPEYHFKMVAALRRQWPILADALDHFAMQQRMRGCGAVNPRTGWVCEWHHDGKHHTLAASRPVDWYDWLDV